MFDRLNRQRVRQGLTDSCAADECNISAKPRRIHSPGGPYYLSLQLCLLTKAALVLDVNGHSCHLPCCQLLEKVGILWIYSSRVSRSIFACLTHRSHR